MSDIEYSDKKIKDNKETNSQLILSWTPPGQLRKKTTDLKGSQNSEYPGFFFYSKSGGYNHYMKETKITSWEPLNIDFILCAQKTVRSYPIKKRKQNSMK